MTKTSTVIVAASSLFSANGLNDVGQPRVVATVLDSFYDDFQSVQSAAAAAQYQSDGGLAFAYRTAPVPPEITQSALSALKVHTAPFLDESNLLSSRFLLGTDDDWQGNLRHGSRVHYDKVAFAVVVYISNRPDEEPAGTSLYTHRTSGIRHISDLPPTGHYSLDNIIADGAEISRWVEHLTVGLVPNRMLLFDPKHFHQAHRYFGHDKTTARIIHNMFFALSAHAESAECVTHDA